jgi:hypothetical protein
MDPNVSVPEIPLEVLNATNPDVKEMLIAVI